MSKEKALFLMNSMKIVNLKSDESIPQLESDETYQQGYKDGNAIDYKKETIDGSVLV